MSDIDPTLLEDRVLGFVLPARNVRGRLVRLGPVLNKVISAHSYPPVVEKLVAEALVLAALLGAMLKDGEGQLTLQAQTQHGAVSLLVADYKGGEVRGYAQFDEDRLAELGNSPSLYGLFGKGYLAITFDQAVSGERYQGIVPLEGGGIGAAAEHYFCQSEQIPSLVQIAVEHVAGEGCVGGGILLQHLPEGEVGRERLHVRDDHPDWEHVTILSRTLTDAELTDQTLTLEDVAWRLFHEEDEIRVLSSSGIVKGCRCDPERIRGVLEQFGQTERNEMADERGIIAVDCAFCSRVFDMAIADFPKPN